LPLALCVLVSIFYPLCSERDREGAKTNELGRAFVFFYPFLNAKQALSLFCWKE